MFFFFLARENNSIEKQWEAANRKKKKNCCGENRGRSGSGVRDGFLKYLQKELPDLFYFLPDTNSSVQFTPTTGCHRPSRDPPVSWALAGYNQWHWEEEDHRKPVTGGKCWHCNRHTESMAPASSSFLKLIASRNIFKTSVLTWYLIGHNLILIA